MRVRDQAESLRMMVRSLQKKIADELFHSSPKRCRVIAVTSGKGGVGKTNIALGLAITLARANYRVVLMDGDVGLANVDVILGLYGRHNLTHVVQGEKELREIIIEGPHGVQIIPGGSGVSELANADPRTLLRLFREATFLDRQADYFFVDTGAGISDQVMTFLLSAQEILLVTTPEHTAITDAYSLVKLYNQYQGRGRLRVIVNMTDSKQEGFQAANRLQHAARSFLKFELEVLGCVAYDAAVPSAVGRHESYVIAAPYAPASLDTIKIASELGNIPIEPPSGVEHFFNGLVGRLNGNREPERLLERGGR
jgi:flagellar biosynthesis protein FlhG